MLVLLHTKERHWNARWRKSNFDCATTFQWRILVFPLFGHPFAHHVVGPLLSHWKTDSLSPLLRCPQEKNEYLLLRISFLLGEQPMKLVAWKSARLMVHLDIVSSNTIGTPIPQKLNFQGHWIWITRGTGNEQYSPVLSIASALEDAGQTHDLQVDVQVQMKGQCDICTWQDQSTCLPDWLIYRCDHMCN